MLTGLAQGEVSPWQDIPEGRVRLLTSGAEGSNTLALGVEVDLNDGWKIYWLYPGPVGLASRFTFDTPASGNIFYPWPERASLQGFSSYGYSGRILFPGIAFAPGSLQVNLAICSQTQCIPFRKAFEIPASVGPDMLVMQKLKQAMETVPVPYSNGHVENAPISVALHEDKITLSGPLGHRVDFLIDPTFSSHLPLSADTRPNAAQDGFFLHTPTESGLGLAASFDLKPGADIQLILDSGMVYFQDEDGFWVLTDSLPEVPGQVHYGQRELDILLGLTQPYPGETRVDWLTTERAAIANQLQADTTGLGRSLGSFLQAALLLFIGGLLLNIMPCVFPILFLKLKTALSGSADLRASFAWTAMGMIATFAMLGLFLALIQGVTGAQLTLGAWMQFPFTTMLLAALIVLFIANALGWFEFSVPGRIASVQGQGVWGDVLAGAVAALLGGACAGALLAFALAYAFSAGGISMVVLLTIMGLGLALPYVLIALVPGAARLLPKPGPWLGWVKPIMAIGLGLTFAYLMFIASRQIAVPALVFMAILALGGLALFRARLRAIALIPLALMALALPWWSLPPDVDERARNYGAEIAAKVEAGETVLVDVTAYWCATCQTNKLLVLNTETVQAMLAEAGVSIFTIHADIYHPNVNAYLAEAGRNSLPLNLVYSPAHPGGIPLPSVLTIAAVREALDASID